MNGLSCYGSWVEGSLKRRRISMFPATFALLILFLILIIIVAFAFPPQQSGHPLFCLSFSCGMPSMESKNAVLVKNEPKNKELLLSISSSSCRKLLKVKAVQTQITESAASEVETNRIWGDDKCSKSDIVINQGPTAPLPNGIPTYTVEIMNVCVTGCGISGIHLYCGWFSSARLINPRIFKRLRFDDCLVNDGKTLVNGRTISFQYANTFRYPLSVSAVIC